MRLAFELLDGIKQIALPNVGGPHLTSLRAERTRNLNKSGLLLLGCLSWTLVFLSLWTKTEPSTLLATLASWLCDRNYTTAPLVFQPEDGTSWDFSASIIVWTNFLYTYTYKGICTHPQHTKHRHSTYHTHIIASVFLATYYSTLRPWKYIT